MELDFKKMTEDELYSIWKSVNAYEWNDLLGPKPEGFDGLPDLRKKKGQRCKADYTNPIFYVVYRMLGKRLERLQYKEQSSFDKVQKLILEYAKPGTKMSDLEPILEHFAKILDS